MKSSLTILVLACESAQPCQMAVYRDFSQVASSNDLDDLFGKAVNWHRWSCVIKYRRIARYRMHGTSTFTFISAFKSSKLNPILSVFQNIAWRFYRAAAKRRSQDGTHGALGRDHVEVFRRYLRKLFLSPLRHPQSMLCVYYMSPFLESYPLVITAKSLNGSKWCYVHLVAVSAYWSLHFL